jgi:hypothetical protein
MILAGNLVLLAFIEGQAARAHLFSLPGFRTLLDLLASLSNK